MGFSDFLSGAGQGAIGGGLIGSMFGPPGTMVGAGIGAGIGAGVGGLSGIAAGRKEAEAAAIRKKALDQAMAQLSQMRTQNRQRYMSDLDSVMKFYGPARAYAARLYGDANVPDIQGTVAQMKKGV